MPQFLCKVGTHLRARSSSESIPPPTRAACARSSVGEDMLLLVAAAPGCILGQPLVPRQVGKGRRKRISAKEFPGVQPGAAGAGEGGVCPSSTAWRSSSSAARTSCSSRS